MVVGGRGSVRKVRVWYPRAQDYVEETTVPYLDKIFDQLDRMLREIRGA